MQDVFTSIAAALEKGASIARVSVMRSSGSTPRAAGACMAVMDDGSMVGTIGGGAVEHKAAQAASRMTPGSSEIRNFDLSNADAANLGMVCGGSMTVFIDVMQPTDDAVEFARTVLDRLEKGDTASIETNLSLDGNVQARNVTANTLAAPTIEKRKDHTLFIEPLPQPRTVHFIGAGHVAQATARIAALTGFRTTVIDDREEFANNERFPDAAAISAPEDLRGCLPDHLGAHDHVVIMTRGHRHDRDVLANALKTKAGYIGMIGSTRKKAAVYESLLDSGYTQADLDRVHCPIGLAINAETPEEIAISIMGEIVAHNRTQN